MSHQCGMADGQYKQRCPILPWQVGHTKCMGDNFWTPQMNIKYVIIDVSVCLRQYISLCRRVSTFEKFNQKLKYKILSQIDKWMEEADLNRDGNVYFEGISRAYFDHVYDRCGFL